jgi:hypothetical protein
MKSAKRGNGLIDHALDAAPPRTDALVTNHLVSDASRRVWNVSGRKTRCQLGLEDSLPSLHKWAAIPLTLLRQEMKAAKSIVKLVIVRLKHPM